MRIGMRNLGILKVSKYDENIINSMIPVGILSNINIMYK